MSNTYDGKVEGVKEASLLDIVYQLGFDVQVRYTTRLAVPDTTEPLFTQDKAYGKTAKQFVNDWLLHHPWFSVEVVERKNGVALAVVRGGDECLNQLLIDEGYQMFDATKRSSKVSIYDREDVEVNPVVSVDWDDAEIGERRRKYL